MKILRKTAFFLVKIPGLFVVFVLIFGTVQYLTTTIYRFHPPKPFSGSNWYNPYQELDSIKVRGNFHAHSRAWGGISHGSGSPVEIRKAYEDSGYQVRSISNYFTIDTNGAKTDPFYIPTYEHGMNFSKTHCLVMNANEIVYTDYLLYQMPSHQQHVIEKIKATGGIITLAHPDFLAARRVSDMRKLEHYDLVEVLNHFKFSDQHWDEGLSSGRLAFLIASDDSHGFKHGQIFRIWTEVFVARRDKSSVLKSLLCGKAVGVATMYYKSPVQNGFVSCKLRNDTLDVQFRSRADSIQFIGQNGVVKKTVKGADRGWYVLQPDDTYIRAKSINAETHIYLNPVVRYSDKVRYASEMVPERQTLLTWLARAFAAILLVVFLMLFRKIWRWKTFRA